MECVYMCAQEARGEGDGEGDPQRGAPAAAGGQQALQPSPPRLPAAPFVHRRLTSNGSAQAKQLSLLGCLLLWLSIIILPRAFPAFLFVCRVEEALPPSVFV